MSEPIILTPAGVEKIKLELIELKTVRRPEVIARIETALKLGDLSENAEYHEAKEESAWTESRIRELEQTLISAIVIEPKHDLTVSMGSVVTIAGSGTQKTYTLVGANEANPGAGLISSQSPLGSALLGKVAGDSVHVPTPTGEREYTIVTVA